jgi:hypothetical protein
MSDNESGNDDARKKSDEEDEIELGMSEDKPPTFLCRKCITFTYFPNYYNYTTGDEDSEEEEEEDEEDAEEGDEEGDEDPQNPTLKNLYAGKFVSLF